MAGGTGAEIERVRESGGESVRLGRKLVVGAAVSDNMPGATCGRIDRLFFSGKGRKTRQGSNACMRAGRCPTCRRWGRNAGVVENDQQDVRSTWLAREYGQNQQVESTHSIALLRATNLSP